MKISPYIKIKKIHSACFAPTFTGTNTTAFVDCNEGEYVPCFYKTRKEAMKAIAKYLPKFIR